MPLLRCEYYVYALVRVCNWSVLRKPSVAARCNSVAFGIRAAFVAVYVASSALQPNNATEAWSGSSSSIRRWSCHCSCSCGEVVPLRRCWKNSTTTKTNAHIFHMHSYFASYLYMVAFRLQHLNYVSAAGRYQQHGFIRIAVVFLSLQGVCWKAAWLQLFVHLLAYVHNSCSV